MNPHDTNSQEIVGESAKDSRKRSKPTVQTFLDIEAVHAGSEDSSTSEEEDDFIDDEDREEDVRDMPPQRNEDTELQEESMFINNLLEKYVDNVSRATYIKQQELQVAWPTWEVTTKVGHEMRTVLRIMRRSLEGVSVGANTPRATFCKPGLPGRVFIEVLNRNDAKTICQNLPDISLKSIRIVKHEHAQDYLDYHDTNTSAKKDSWVRLNRKPFKGDLVYVTNVHRSDLAIDVVAIPRVDYSKGKRKRTSKPDAALLDVTRCRRAFGHGSVVVEYDAGNSETEEGVVTAYRFHNQEYDPAGYLRIDRIPWGKYVLAYRATREEYARFSSCKSVSAVSFSNAIKRAECDLVKYDDRIIIEEGLFKGRSAMVKEIYPDYVEVELHGTGYNELFQVPLLDIRRAFELGDRVRTVAGPSIGIEGFISSVANDNRTVTIHTAFPMKPSIEAHMNDIRLIRQEHALGKPKKSAQPFRNIRNVELERLVNMKVVNKAHVSKGLSGTIRSINSLGVANIELDTLSPMGARVMQQSVLQLYFIVEEDNRLYEIHNEHTYDLVPSTYTVAKARPERAVTPIPEQEMEGSEDAAWTLGEGECSETLPPQVERRIPAHHWSYHVAGKITKLKPLLVQVLRRPFQFEGDEFSGREGHLRKIQDNLLEVFIPPRGPSEQGVTRDIYYPYVSCMPPTRNGQTVCVIKPGPEQGSIHNVVNYGKHMCNLGAARGGHKFHNLKQMETSYLARYV